VRVRGPGGPEPGADAESFAPEGGGLSPAAASPGPGLPAGLLAFLRRVTTAESRQLATLNPVPRINSRPSLW